LASPDAGGSCAGGNVVESAKMPEIDLYQGSDRTFARTLKQAEFPSCLPILAQGPDSMLEVEIGGQDYWVPPTMVNFRSNAPEKRICLTLRNNDDEQKKVGATRGLGEHCHDKMGSGK
jgi:hypothetical protein